MSATNDMVLSPDEGGGLTFIEQLHAAALELCPHPRVPYLIGLKHKDKKQYLIRGQCGLWSCPVCGSQNGRKWLARILQHINHETKCPRWYFLTITAHPNWRGASASVKNIRQGWKKLYNRMRRKYGVSEYVKVWEYHKDGSFHLHLLIGRKIGKKWLKDNSAECGMGYMCDSSKAKNPGMVAGYVAKYLLKSFENADRYPKGMRRIEASRSWTALKELESDMDDWIVSFNRTAQLKSSEVYKQHRYSVIDRVPTELEQANSRQRIKKLF